jgi:hypothetical protein
MREFTVTELHSDNRTPSSGISVIPSQAGWRKLHNEELVARMEEKRNAYKILVGKPEGKRPLGRPRRRWVNNIKMDLREIRWNDVD